MLLCGVDLDVLGTFLTTPFLYFHDCVRIDPGNAFRLVVKSEKFKANLEYGLLDMGEMWHEWWVDLNSGYNLEKFMNDMASKIIWVPAKLLLCGLWIQTVLLNGGLGKMSILIR